MNLVQFGPQRILRPRHSTAIEFHNRARAALFRHFRPGTYCGRDEVNPIIRKHFEFYDQRLRIIAPKLASRGCAELLLSQYDEAEEILHGNGIASDQQKEAWARIEPAFKRGIKYLTELFCIVGNPGEAKAVRWNVRGADRLVEEALICAEMLADLSEMSNRAYHILPDDFELTLNPPGSGYVFDTAVRGKHSGFDQRFGQRIEFDRRERGNYMGATPQFDIHTDSHRPFLDPAFEAEFGMSYGQFIQGLMAVIDGAMPVAHGFPTLFIRRSDLVKKLCEPGWPREAVELMLRGFTVTPNMLLEEGRVIWNAKQESRAYRRGFFRFPHPTGGHLAFSRSMAREALIHLVVGGCYQKLPAEWNRGPMAAGLSRLSNAAGRWFERLVGENLQKAGFAGGQARDFLGGGKARLPIPKEVGDLDYIGWHPGRGTVLLIEAKMTNTGIEAQYWRDDLDQFVRRRDSHAAQFRRKISWTLGNREAILNALGAPVDSDFEFRLVTLYPCIAAEFIEDFKCLSLAELMAEF